MLNDYSVVREASLLTIKDWAGASPFFALDTDLLLLHSCDPLLLHVNVASAGNVTRNPTFTFQQILI